MALKDDLKCLLFDTRLIDFNIRNGKITQEELRKHHSALEDLADRTAQLEFHEDGFDDGDETH